jgi:hypothetical protein
LTFTLHIMALPAARALRSYCTGISHGPVSAAIPNVGGGRGVFDNFPSPVGKTASGESGQNNGGLMRGRGIGNFEPGLSGFMRFTRILGRVMNERWPDRKAGQKVKACGGELFSVLIFCFFSIKRKDGASAAASGECLAYTKHERCRKIRHDGLMRASYPKLQ